MRTVKELSIGGNTVQVRELTVADIRAWLKDLEGEAAGADVLDATLFEDFTLADLARMTSLDTAAMDAMSPGELRQVADACREVNADFFGMRGRLLSLGQAALARLGET